MGKEISIEQAFACIGQHRKEPNLTIPTHAVNFSGPALMDWMNRTASRMRSSGKDDFGFSMALGQLTGDFLQANSMEPERVKLLTGRTTIFIVPYATDKSGTNTPASDGEGFSAYEFGSLEP